MTKHVLQAKINIMSTKNDEVHKVLTRGVDDVLPSRKDLGTLMAEKKIKIYQGFDPSSKDLHIGNWIGIRKLAQFQKLVTRLCFLLVTSLA